MKKYVVPKVVIVEIANDEIISTSTPVDPGITKASFFTEGERSDEVH